MSESRWPNFVIIGAAKAGTTSLASYLAQHPSVFVTDPKEPMHFTAVGAFRDPADYLALYDRAPPDAARGEASTQYTRQLSLPGVPQRIARVAADARLVYLVRDPIDRLKSHYLMRLRQGRTAGTFEKFATRPEEVDASCYGAQLAAYLEEFPVEQICVERLEDLSRDPLGVVRRVAEHIGVDASGITETTFDILNAAPAAASRPRRVPVPTRVSKMFPSRWRRAVKRRMPHVIVHPDDLELPAAIWSELKSKFDEDGRWFSDLLDRPGFPGYAS